MGVGDREGVGGKGTWRGRGGGPGAGARRHALPMHQAPHSNQPPLEPTQSHTPCSPAHLAQHRHANVIKLEPHFAAGVKRAVVVLGGPDGLERALRGRPPRLGFGDGDARGRHAPAELRAQLGRHRHLHDQLAAARQRVRRVCFRHAGHRRLELLGQLLVGLGLQRLLARAKRNLRGALGVGRFAGRVPEFATAGLPSRRAARRLADPNTPRAVCTPFPPSLAPPPAAHRDGGWQVDAGGKLAPQRRQVLGLGAHDARAVLIHADRPLAAPPVAWAHGRQEPSQRLGPQQRCWVCSKLVELAGRARWPPTGEAVLSRATIINKGTSITATHTP